MPRISAMEATSAAAAARQRSLLNRMTDEQKKWKGTVQEQRRNIYDRHTMLNQPRTRILAAEWLCQCQWWACSNNMNGVVCKSCVKPTFQVPAPSSNVHFGHFNCIAEKLHETGLLIFCPIFDKVLTDCRTDGEIKKGMNPRPSCWRLKEALMRHHYYIHSVS